MLDFNLITGDGKNKSDLAIILILVKETQKNKIKWQIDYNYERIARFTTYIDISDTTKKIKIVLYVNRFDTQRNDLTFFYQKKSYITKVVRMLYGQQTTTLLKTIENQLGI